MTTLYNTSYLLYLSKNYLKNKSEVQKYTVNEIYYLLKTNLFKFAKFTTENKKYFISDNLNLQSTLDKYELLNYPEFEKYKRYLLIKKNIYSTYSFRKIKTNYILNPSLYLERVTPELLPYYNNLKYASDLFETTLYNVNLISKFFNSLDLKSNLINETLNPFDTIKYIKSDFFNINDLNSLYTLHSNSLIKTFISSSIISNIVQTGLTGTGKYKLSNSLYISSDDFNYDYLKFLDDELLSIIDTFLNFIISYIISIWNFDESLLERIMEKIDMNKIKNELFEDCKKYNLKYFSEYLFLDKLFSELLKNKSKELEINNGGYQYIKIYRSSDLPTDEKYIFDNLNNYFNSYDIDNLKSLIYIASQYLNDDAEFLNAYTIVFKDYYNNFINSERLKYKKAESLNEFSIYDYLIDLLKKVADVTEVDYNGLYSYFSNLNLKINQDDMDYTFGQITMSYINIYAKSDNFKKVFHSIIYPEIKKAILSFHHFDDSVLFDLFDIFYMIFYITSSKSIIDKKHFNNIRDLFEDYVKYPSVEKKINIGSLDRIKEIVENTFSKSNNESINLMYDKLFDSIIGCHFGYLYSTSLKNFK